MGQRRFLERIFFQGKPATNASLARTLAAVTGRDVWVPANPGAMGAVGIALLAADGLAKRGGGRRRRGLRGGRRSGAALRPGSDAEARIAARREMHCGDKRCANMCRLEKATVAVGGHERTIVSGGNCPKYDTVSSVGEKLPKDARIPSASARSCLPVCSLMRRRATDRRHPRGRQRRQRPPVGWRSLAGWRPSAGPPPGARRPIVALPYAHYLIDLLPFFHGFFTALGATVRVVRPGRGTLAEGDRLCAAAGVCAPAKLLHGLAAEASGADFVFAPKFVHLAYPTSGSGTSTCPMAQGTPELVDAALGAPNGEGRAHAAGAAPGPVAP